MASSKRLAENLARDLFVLEDESNPRGSRVDTVWPSTILDQVFDQLSPTNKTLREIIEDLKQEIITGGRGNIIFPVTSVNGKTDDIILTPTDIGLGSVDNTRDMDKPLSVPQREAIMAILKEYDFNVDLTALYQHLGDTNNPHDVTLEQINKGDVLTDFINRRISTHNLSTKNGTHPDIRRSLSRLWTLVENVTGNVEERIEKVLSTVDEHYGDLSAHADLFMKKENVSNKSMLFSAMVDNDHTKYPSTRAVVEFVARQLIEFRETLPQVQNWIDDIQVIDYRADLPDPTPDKLRKAYFIRNGINCREEVAICRLNSDGVNCSWDISQMGAVSQLNPKHFEESIDGFSIKMDAIIQQIMSKNGLLDKALEETLSHYYTIDQIKEFDFVQTIHLLPGTMDGTIRFYVNNDRKTMSKDVEVAGLKRLAYLEWVTENELQEQSVHERHILTNAVETRHIKQGAVTPNKISCMVDHIIGNTRNNPEGIAHEIPLESLAKALVPYLDIKITEDLEEMITEIVYRIWEEIFGEVPDLPVDPTIYYPTFRVNHRSGSLLANIPDDYEGPKFSIEQGDLIAEGVRDEIRFNLENGNLMVEDDLSEE
ncbi:MAG: hypothetical protein NC548_12855 [Lachnospiraceae bacterium]|nr:hypothetical protein [Lachnospiraceae bacterium]MCM1230720.1 hypothetical protein [Ruminococcus flavefaciens]